MNEKRIEEIEENRLLWYSFGIRARQLLQDTIKVQLDEFDVKDFECLQVACRLRWINSKKI